MARELSDVEVFYIQNSGESADAMSAKLGVDPSVIQAKLQNVPTKPHTALSAKPHESIFKGKTDEEVKAIIHNPDEHKTYNNFARAEGVTVMTQAASELSDARKVLQINKPNAKEQKDKIHVIHSNRPTR